MTYGIRNVDGDSSKIVDEMFEHASQIARELMECREEVLEAFVAKYGFQPDECEQIHQGDSWYVVRIDPAMVEQVQRSVILSRLSQKKFTRWQNFCLWMAGVK